MRNGWSGRWIAGLVGALALTLAGPAGAGAPAGRKIELMVTSKGFEPTPVKVQKGVPLTLVVTRKTDRTCAKDLVVPSEGIQVALPLDRPVEVHLTPTKTGELKYGCAMQQMVGGVLVVE
jgi:plastocyanin domain-containing protein